MDRGDWQATVHGVAKSRTRLSTMHKDMTGLNICPAALLSATLYFLITRAVHGEGNGSPHQHSCLKNPMDGGTWWAAVHGVAKSRTRLSDFTFTFHFHALEKEMATHSSVLAWRIPGTG